MTIPTPGGDYSPNIPTTGDIEIPEEPVSKELEDYAEEQGLDTDDPDVREVIDNA